LANGFVVAVVAGLAGVFAAPAQPTTSRNAPLRIVQQTLLDDIAAFPIQSP
jgi:hypothetical protein